MTRSLPFVVLATFVLSACSTTPPAIEPLASISNDQARQYDEQSLALASMAVEDRRYKDAELIVLTVLRHDPNNQFASYLRAEILMSKGSTKKAEAEFSALTDIADLRPKALQGQGIANILMGRPLKAQALLNEAVTLDPTLWRAWNALGAANDINTEFENAAFAYTRALALRPDSADVYNNRGFSKLQNNDADGAIRDFQSAIELDPEFSTAEMNLRLAYAFKGMYVHALSGASDQERNMILNNTGYMAMLRGDYEAAKGYLNAAMDEKASFYRKAWKNLTYLQDVQNLDKE